LIFIEIKKYPTKNYGEKEEYKMLAEELRMTDFNLFISRYLNEN